MANRHRSQAAKARAAAAPIRSHKTDQLSVQWSLCAAAAVKVDNPFINIVAAQVACVQWEWEVPVPQSPPQKAGNDAIILCVMWQISVKWTSRSGSTGQEQH